MVKKDLMEECDGTEKDCDGGVGCSEDTRPTPTQCKKCLCSKCSRGKCPVSQV